MRYRSDGTLEFLGRLDQQVKVRGHRIELGEIETMLARHPAVRETALLLLTDRSGEKQLAAFVVPAAGQMPDPDALRAHLRHHLPDYMIPSTFSVLDALPLTPNGKLDRQALGALRAGRAEPGTQPPALAGCKGAVSGTSLPHTDSEPVGIAGWRHDDGTSPGTVVARSPGDRSANRHAGQFLRVGRAFSAGGYDRGPHPRNVSRRAVAT